MPWPPSAVGQRQNETPRWSGPAFRAGRNPKLLQPLTNASRAQSALRLLHKILAFCPSPHARSGTFAKRRSRTTLSGLRSPFHAPLRSPPTADEAVVNQSIAGEAI